MTDELEITMSPLCQSHEEDGLIVAVEIYSGNKQDWVLEVVSNDKSIIWEHTFPSDAEALAAFQTTLAEQGLQGIINTQE
jgi:maltooligosyltrehalose synthase